MMVLGIMAGSETPLHVRRKAAAGLQQDPAVVTVSALGDLMLAGEWDDLGRAGGIAAALGELAAVTAADLVFANLEVTTHGHEGLIPKEPRLVGELTTIDAALQTLRVDLVNLANNHTFDSYASGFARVQGLLAERQILGLGAGADAQVAARPLQLERQGLRFGWLAFAAPDTRPSHLASAAGYGVNPLVAEHALAQVAALKPQVDHVIVSLHWGVEYCHLPSPDQIALARQLIDRGARLVIGHHAHVLQGVEAYGHGVIVYNLGNAVTTDLTIGGRLAIRATPRTRSSLVLRAGFGRDRLVQVELVPFLAARGRVRVGDPFALRIVDHVQRQLARGISAERWRRVRFYEDVVLRTWRKLDPRVIRSLRGQHLKKFFLNIVHALRGQGPAG